MPWPDDNPCEGHNESNPDVDTVPDEKDCHCFYHCSEQDTVLGHNCCAPGLAYNPETDVCDWEEDVPSCNTH